MRFPLNSSETSAVKTKHGLGADTVLLPKRLREDKGSPMEILWNPYGNSPV
jgi:hypothetical protein